MTRERHSRIVVALAAVAAVFVVLPLVGVAVRMPWSGAWAVISSRSVRTAVWVSLSTSVVSAVIAVAERTRLGFRQVRETLGLSLAGYNALISLLMTAIALVGLRGLVRTR